MLVEQTRLLIKACGPSGPAGSIGLEPETQALLEAVLIHLRLLDEFLGNQGRDTDVRAVVMSPTTAECASVRTSSTVTFGGQLDASEAPPLEGRQDLRLPEPHRPALATEQPEPRKVSPLEPVEYGRGGRARAARRGRAPSATSRSLRRHPCTLETPGGAPRHTPR